MPAYAMNPLRRGRQGRGLGVRDEGNGKGKGNGEMPGLRPRRYN